jgi:GNAT superfamily N-acetyltransferase
MNSPVTGADLDRIENFYWSRGAPASIDLCPLADPSLAELLGRRGYRITEFNNVLVTSLPCPAAASAAAAIRIVAPEEAGRWTRTMIGGFFERDELSEEELAIGAGIFRMPNAGAFLAEPDGVPSAAAAACARDRLLYLFGDSTLPRFRRLGLHAALIQARLAWGVSQECNLAAACTLPGSGSQRNYQRAGFVIAYTKMTLCRDLARA